MGHRCAFRTDRNRQDQAMSEHHPSEDKDLPLRDDIRLLGRVLGDTVRA